MLEEAMREHPPEHSPVSPSTLSPSVTWIVDLESHVTAMTADRDV